MLSGGSDSVMIPIGISPSSYYIFFCLQIARSFHDKLVLMLLLQAWEALWHAEHFHKGTVIQLKHHDLGIL